jgi:uncharacterized repeat protein (TIGR01451 family)
LQPGVETAVGVSPVPGANRGGDYSATEYDPSNPSNFWSANEYNFDTTGNNFHWGTQIAEYTLSPPITADLAVTNSGPTSVTAGTNATYTITLTNGGPSAAANLVLTDTLPAGSSFVSMTPAAGNPDTFTFVQSGGSITETAASVPSGNSDTFTLVVFAPSNLANGANFSDTATVSSNGADPTPGDNTATVTGTVVNTSQSADLAVTNPGPGTGTEGNNITYNLSVTNNGPSDAAGTVLTDTLGANLRFVSATTSQGTFTQSGGVVTFSFGTVTNGQTVTATVTAQPTEDGNLTDNASVSSNLPDPNTGNNTAGANTTVAEGLITVTNLTVTGKRLNNVAVATFTHANGVEPTSAFMAVIDWGDGTTSSGTISLSGTTYTVRGTHNYGGKSVNGAHTPTTTVTEPGNLPTHGDWADFTLEPGGTWVVLDPHDSAGAGLVGQSGGVQSFSLVAFEPGTTPSPVTGGTDPVIILAPGVASPDNTGLPVDLGVVLPGLGTLNSKRKATSGTGG